MSTRICWTMLIRTVTDWNGHNAQQKGAALAFYTMFSLVPLLLLATALLGSRIANVPSCELVIARTRSMVGPESARAVGDLLRDVSNPKVGKWASGLNLLVLLVGATVAVGELQTSLNHIWKAQPRESGVADFVETRLLYVAFLVVVGLLLIGTLILSTAAAVFSNYMAQTRAFTAFAMGSLNMALCFSVLTLLFAVIYKVLPQTKIAWHDVWVGAVVTSILFMIGNCFLGIYIGGLSGAPAFGPAGSMVMVVVWAYYCAQILYLGAEFTHVYAETRGSRK